MIVKECLYKFYKDICFMYVGDGCNNVVNVLMIGVFIVGMIYYLVCFKELELDFELFFKC